MSALIAALPMYDWPECRIEIDKDWRELRALLCQQGLEAPARLARCNADLPPLPDVESRDSSGLPGDGLDVSMLWRHPDLLVSQTCWGPLRGDLEACVHVVAQPSYDGIEGGQGIFYSSAIVMRRSSDAEPVSAPGDGRATVPWELLENSVFAYNATDSMSGFMALNKDYLVADKGVPDPGSSVVTGSHRVSIRAVAAGTADFAAIDCKSWSMAKEHERAANDLVVVGWTRLRKGLPIITSRHRSDEEIAKIKSALANAGKFETDIGNFAPPVEDLRTRINSAFSRRPDQTGARS